MAAPWGVYAASLQELLADVCLLLKLHLQPERGTAFFFFRSLIVVAVQYGLDCLRVLIPHCSPALPIMKLFRCRQRDLICPDFRAAFKFSMQL